MIPTLFLPLFSGSVAGVTPPPDLPANLLAAIVARAATEPVFEALGGFWKDEAPKPPGGTPQYYAIVSSVGSTLESDFKVYVWNNRKIRFRIEGVSAGRVEAAGESMMLALPKWTTLLYTNGFSCPMVEAARSSGRNTRRSSGEPGAWFFEGTFTVRCKEVHP